MYIPTDPIMLLSFLNLKLRDYYDSLGALCSDNELDEEEIKKKMLSVGYTYDESKNRFV